MKYEIEFENPRDLDQFKRFLEMQYLEHRLDAFRYGRDEDASLSKILLNIMQQLEAQGEDHD